MKKGSSTTIVFLFVFIGMCMTNALATDHELPNSKSLDDYWYWWSYGPVGPSPYYQPPNQKQPPASQEPPSRPPPAGPKPPQAGENPPPSNGYNFNPFQCAQLYADAGICVGQFYTNDFNKEQCCGIFQQLKQCPGGPYLPYSLPKGTCS